VQDLLLGHELTYLDPEFAREAEKRRGWSAALE